MEVERDGGGDGGGLFVRLYNGPGSLTVFTVELCSTVGIMESSACALSPWCFLSWFSYSPSLRCMHVCMYVHTGYGRSQHQAPAVAVPLPAS
jgi:hypothetical protein